MIMLVPVGEIDASAVKFIRRHVSETLGEASRAIAGIPLPLTKLGTRMWSVLGKLIINKLSIRSGKMLGLVEADLFAPVMGYATGTGTLGIAFYQG